MVGLHCPSTQQRQEDPRGRPMLTLHTVNRDESLSVAPLNDLGGFSSIDLDRIAHLLRAANGDEHPIDPRTVSLVYRIQVRFGTPEIRVVSGYRTPRPGSHSNHCKGRAVDLIVPGVPDEEVARMVREIGFTGVGVYPRSQFVHVDIRPQSYFWVDESGPHMRNREHAIFGDLASQSDAAALARGQDRVEPFLLSTDVDRALRSGEPGAPTGQPDAEEEE
jgi:uncharacterized protein YcbK (DUF882 family)